MLPSECKICDIYHLAQNLEKAGYKINGERVTVGSIVSEILEVEELSPEEVRTKGLEELYQTHRFTAHGNSTYIDTVGVHQERLANIHDFIAPTIRRWNKSNSGKIDLKYLLFFFENHDIPEGIFQSIGDISTMVKKLLDARSKKTLGDIELLGVRKIGHKGFKVTKKHYQMFETDTVEKTSTESLLGGYMDKLDGLCAAFLEVLQGNRERIVPLRNYIKIFWELKDTELASLIQDIGSHTTQHKTRGRSNSQKLQRMVGGLFDLDEITSLDGSERFSSKPRFQTDIELDAYLIDKFLGVGFRYLFDEWNEDALELIEELKLPGFFRAWLASQKISLYKDSGYTGPARNLQTRI